MTWCLSFLQPYCDYGFGAVPWNGRGRRLVSCPRGVKVKGNSVIFTIRRMDEKHKYAIDMVGSLKSEITNQNERGLVQV